MTKFTSEFIAKTRETIKQISPLPWKACSCGKCGMISGDKDLIATATRGNWGDDYPIIKPVGGSIGGQYEVVMEQITYGHVPPETGNINAQYIAEACTNYPEALDHIEQLQKRVQELEKESNRISVLLHNEMSQLELVIDLSNKRWIALNNIYTDGEKHNANWCKRKAQEGLGIK